MNSRILEFENLCGARERNQGVGKIRREGGGTNDRSRRWIRPGGEVNAVDWQCGLSRSSREGKANEEKGSLMGVRVGLTGCWGIIWRARRGSLARCGKSLRESG